MIQYSLTLERQNSNMNDYNKIQELIEKAENIIIFSHINPDGDTISSVLALSLAIKSKYNKEAVPVYMSKYPEIYSFLPKCKLFKNINEIDKTKVYDLAIAVDIASKDRLMDASDIYFKAKHTINIDHHKTNNGYGEFNYIDPDACSAGQVLFDIFYKLNIEINKDIAKCLYVSIMTDTGGFKYENTDARTLYTAAELVKKGANPCYIFRACYESKPQAMVQLQALAISKAVFLNNGKVAYVIITKDMMKQFNATDDYTDGIAEALRQIQTVEISIVLKENDAGHTKVSMRSKETDLTKIAVNFGGGGHKFAAGCTIKKNPKVAINKLLECIESEM